MNHLLLKKKNSTPGKKLNEFLISNNVIIWKKQWEEAPERTKKLYTRKARQTVSACLDEIAPGEAETLLSSLVKSKLEKILSIPH